MLRSIDVPLSSGSPPVDLSLLKNVALVVFFSIFAGIVVRLLLLRRGHYDRASRLPLDDESAADKEQARHG